MSTWLPDQMVAALPELFMAVSIMALLMIGVFRGDSYARTICWFAAAVTVVASLVVAGTSAGPGGAFGGMFIADEFARYG
ncbi:MAG: NADH-quinone oxidoreductase subunit N, partial [Alphaproteobacteria bacterium]|nr:NADH-quinone oxidoreductase subunit N [Alphaproteobacteria bacterium]